MVERHRSKLRRRIYELEEENELLRERVESLERALQRYADEDNWLWGEDDQHPEGYWSEFIDDEGHEGPELALAALSPANAHAKLETRSEEEK